MTLPRGYFSGKQNIILAATHGSLAPRFPPEFNASGEESWSVDLKKKIDGKGDPSGHENSAPVLHPMTKDDNFYELFSDLKDIGWWVTIGDSCQQIFFNFWIFWKI